MLNTVTKTTTKYDTNSTTLYLITKITSEYSTIGL